MMSSKSSRIMCFLAQKKHSPLNINQKLETISLIIFIILVIVDHQQVRCKSLWPSEAALRLEDESTFADAGDGNSWRPVEQARREAAVGLQHRDTSAAAAEQQLMQTPPAISYGRNNNNNNNNNDDDNNDHDHDNTEEQEDAENAENNNRNEDGSRAEQQRQQLAENEAAAAEAAERKELEAAEASEAEAADRSALDEQKQQQREIIMAQAKREAKAIKEQQEALMRQQQTLQQQLMFSHKQHLKRKQNEPRKQQQRTKKIDASDDDGGNDLKISSSRSDNLMSSPLRIDEKTQQHQHQEARRRHQLLPTVANSATGGTPLAFNHRLIHLSREPGDGNSEQLDTHFSDQLDNNNSNNNLNRNRQTGGNEDDEMSDYSVQTATISSPPPQAGESAKAGDQSEASDLLPVAQHAHLLALDSSDYYSSPKKGHDYYQYAESHKKGQYEAGFKRGNKKFQISGHSSQHKSHAEGHVKWHGKKGKGSQYWDYKHKNKKPDYYHHH